MRCYQERLHRCRGSIVIFLQVLLNRTGKPRLALKQIRLLQQCNVALFNKNYISIVRSSRNAPLRWCVRECVRRKGTDYIRSLVTACSPVATGALVRSSGSGQQVRRRTARYGQLLPGKAANERFLFAPAAEWDCLNCSAFVPCHRKVSKSVIELISMEESAALLLIAILTTYCLQFTVCK